LSLIPVSALERIDVLTDGASSIYGGDAVAGVINFVLRDDFDGFESAARIGNVTSGEMKEFRIGQTAGSSWESGNVLATYEFFSRENLPLSDRDEFLASGTFSPLRPEAFDLLPEQRRLSAVVSGNQQVAERLDLSLSGLFSHRISDRSSVHQTTGVIELYDATSNNLSVGAGLDYELSDKWSLLLAGAFNKLWSEDTATNNPNSPTEYESGVWSVDLRTSGTLLTFPAGDVRLAIGGHVRGEDFRAENIARVLRQADRTVTAAYAEIALPIIGQANAQ
jgi:outer membrane receptor protein involved in Fe transport